MMWQIKSAFLMSIAVRGFELQDDVAFLSASQPFVAQGGTGDGTTEAFKGGPLMWAAVHGGMKAKAVGADTALGWV